MASLLSNNITNLQSLLDKVNTLPEVSSGVELPELTNEGAAGDLLSGKQMIDSSGNIVDGTFSIDNELSTQDNLISQIQTALSTKAAGVVLPCLENPATAENLEEGYELIDGDGNVVVGTHICSGGGAGSGDEERISFSIINNLPDMVSVYGKICIPGETTVVSAPVEASSCPMYIEILIGSCDGEFRDYYNNYSVLISYPMEGEDGELYNENFAVHMAPQDAFPIAAIGVIEVSPYGGDCFTLYCEEV